MLTSISIENFRCFGKFSLVIHVINYGGCRDVALQRLYWISFITINGMKHSTPLRELI